MKKKNIIFLLTLFAVLIVIGGCIEKVDRTFGPITLNITSSENTIIQGDTVTLTADLGFEDYSWTIVGDPHSCTIEKIGANQAKLTTYYFLTQDTYPITIKVTDAKGNSSTKNFVITKYIITLSKDELNSNDGSDYLTVSASDIPNFDHFVINYGTYPQTIATFSDSRTNPAQINSSGNGIGNTGKIYVRAVDSNGKTSVQTPIIVYCPFIFQCESQKDGYVSYVKNSGFYFSTADKPKMITGNDTNAKIIYRSFFGFDIPGGMPTTAYKAYITLVKTDEMPSNVFQNNKGYMRYIGKDTIADSLTNSVTLFKSLDADIDDPNNHYYDLHCKDGEYLVRFEFSPQKNPWLFERLRDIGYSSSGGYFDFGIRLYDENLSQYNTVNFSTSEGVFAPQLEVRLY